MKTLSERLRLVTDKMVGHIVFLMLAGLTGTPIAAGIYVADAAPKDVLFVLIFMFAVFAAALRLLILLFQIPSAFDVERLENRIHKLGLLSRKLLTQEAIDQHLRRLALTYQRACERQNRLQTELAGGKDTKSKEEKEMLRKVEVEVKDTQDEFWSAHGVALSLGFVMKERFKDYLPSEGRAVA